MLELNTSFSMSHIPYITYDALDAYATDLVRDFTPERLVEPGTFDVDGFIEYYLGLDMMFCRICYDRKILGMTAFNDGIIQIACEHTGRPEPLTVSAGTVIIDTSLSTKRNLPRLRFTVIHEGSHWLLHRGAFATDNPFGNPSQFENQYLAAKEGRIDYSRCQSERSDSERMERQADFLASAILMPLPAMRIAFRKFFSFYDEKPRQIVRGVSLLDDCYAKQLPEYISKTFDVSKRAAMIRLEKLNAIVDKGHGFNR